MLIMKKLLLPFLVAATLATTALTFTGCAHSEHGHAGMSCSKCSCKMMEADSANPEKCKMCGHSKAEHSEHQH